MLVEALESNDVSGNIKDTTIMEGISQKGWHYLR